MTHYQLLNVNETAAALRLKPSTIRAWILQRRIPFVRLGRRVFIRRQDCELLIVSNIVAPSVEGTALKAESL